MKLLHYTYYKLSALLFLLMAVWGILFYYAMMDEVMDETDDALKNYAHILIRRVLHDPSILNTTGSFMSFYQFRPITEEEGIHYRDQFYDSTIYVELEHENEPVRVMRTAFRMPDGQFHELTLMLSTLERDDLIEAIFWYISALFLLFLICTSIGIRLVLKSVFRPLQKLLQWLNHIHPGQTVPPLDNPTRIREFQQLSKAAVEMGNRGHRAYEEQKQFIENASHELQTPLAIIRSKVELLAESEGLSEQQMCELDAIYTTLNRTVKLNKSLLLLSRIENGQYAETEDIVVDKLLDELLPGLMDIYAHKHIRLTRQQGKQPFTVHGNPTLIQIMISNLLKNALLHSPEEGELKIITTPASLQISNNGKEALDQTRLFTRFYHGTRGKKESTGLGLAIARSAAISASLSLTYRWEKGMHTFSIVKEAKRKD